MITKDLVSPLRDLRKRKKITSTKLSIKTGIPEYILLKLERGEQVPDFEQSVRLGCFYEIPWHLVMERCHDYKNKIKTQKLYKKLSELRKESSELNKEKEMEKRTCNVK